jgi:hypothetical protein
MDTPRRRLQTRHAIYLQDHVARSGVIPTYVTLFRSPQQGIQKMMEMPQGSSTLSSASSLLAARRACSMVGDEPPTPYKVLAPCAGPDSAGGSRPDRIGQQL